MIDGKSDKVLTTLTTGNGPVAAYFNPVNNLVYVANADDASISVISDE